MIAQANPSELDDAVELAEEFHEAMGLSGVFNRDVWVKGWSELLESRQGEIFKRCDDGGLREAIGLFYSCDGFTGDKCANIAFWFVREGDSSLAVGLLMTQVEKKLMAMGVKKISVHVRLGQNYESVFRALCKRGFVPVETHMKKEFIYG